MRRPVTEKNIRFKFPSLEATEKIQEELLKLIFHTETKALHILTLYSTFIGALATAGLTLFQLKLLDISLLGFLISMSLLFLTGNYFAYRAVWTANIYLPGRKAVFWQWAAHAKISKREIIERFLSDSANCSDHNVLVNDRAASALHRALICGLMAPVTGITIASIGLWIRINYPAWAAAVEAAAGQCRPS